MSQLTKHNFMLLERINIMLNITKASQMSHKVTAREMLTEKTLTENQELIIKQT